ncbi:hypothetical protein DB30_03021 [Enhygromyxa salina]|uniref:Uncharacterized protein n=2 Tax=Enhygromyxa salina TaxID=215803 RepID=A0A0C2CUS7_9BACT|nr:hypothetical protein DB30_03021 [Enhygromyxa salina]
MVTVVSGPGDAAQEQERWENFIPTSIQGMQSMSIGKQGFELERVE